MGGLQRMLQPGCGSSCGVPPSIHTPVPPSMHTPPCAAHATGRSLHFLQVKALLKSNKELLAKYEQTLLGGARGSAGQLQLALRKAGSAHRSCLVVVVAPV